MGKLVETVYPGDINIAALVDRNARTGVSKGTTQTR